ncbi:MAG: hypothetical protein M3Q85_06270 [Acidobacteriota bacterium]|nr:hypothetical protein [Acidobacteriota bacterium]
MAFILIWNFAASGFCWESTPDYFVQNIVIDPGRMEQPEVALRARRRSCPSSRRRRSIW